MRATRSGSSVFLVLLAQALGCGGGGEDAGGEADAVTCDGESLAIPEDPGERGPWPVGARTVTVAGLRTEIWYPAEVGSEAGKEKIRYDLREHLPESDQDKIPDEDNPWQPCDCTRDLPVDAAHGPYPVVVFLHGTASFRTQSATQATHWASRGFVVVASDYPGLELRDALELKLGADQPADAGRLLDALSAGGPELDFLSGRLDPERTAVAGYGAGGRSLRRFGDRRGVRVLIPMAAGGVAGGEALLSTLILGAMADVVTDYEEQQAGYASTPGAKRLVGLREAGHLAFTDLCPIGRDRGGLLQVATDFGVPISPLIVQLAQESCQEGQLAPERGWQIINYATAAALEEQLACNAGSAAKLSTIQRAFPEVGEYKESR